MRPDFGTPGRWHIDPSAKQYSRKVIRTGRIIGRSMGDYGRDPFEESSKRDWSGIPFLERCHIHFFHRHLLDEQPPWKYRCNCESA